MRAVWREGVVPLLQMHDCLDCSVNSREQAELVARLGEEAVKLDVPMRVDLKYGRSWGDASHSWNELNGATPRSGLRPLGYFDPGGIIPRSRSGLPPRSSNLSASCRGTSDPVNYRPPGPKPKSNGRYPSGDHNQPGTPQASSAQYVYLDAGGRNYLLVRRYEWFTTAADSSSEKHKKLPSVPLDRNAMGKGLQRGTEGTVPVARAHRCAA